MRANKDIEKLKLENELWITKLDFGYQEILLPTHIQRKIVIPRDSSQYRKFTFRDQT